MSKRLTGETEEKSLVSFFLFFFFCMHPGVSSPQELEVASLVKAEIPHDRLRSIVDALSGDPYHGAVKGILESADLSTSVVDTLTSSAMVCYYTRMACMRQLSAEPELIFLPLREPDDQLIVEIPLLESPPTTPPTYSHFRMRRTRRYSPPKLPASFPLAVRTIASDQPEYQI
jgi:hypothetical protein